MAEKKNLVALGALVSYRDDSGKVRYLYAGAQVPDSMPKEEVERLQDGELIGPDPQSPDLVPGVGLPPTAKVGFEPEDKSKK
jgi:hypothetical protein